MVLFGTGENFVPALPTSPLPPPPTNSLTGCIPTLGNQSNPEYDHYNSGGNVNGSGIQKSGDVKVRNHSPKTGLLNLGSVGSNKGNACNVQLLGDVKIGN
uniref:Uncharacterized protein n=1 Tax=Opuntia streptacantha TaxID=393608 RepID=A0A7C8ZS43_OPUST